MTHKFNTGSPRHIFVCEDSNEGILTAIYDAFDYGSISHNRNIGIVISGTCSMDMFCEYEDVTPDNGKVYKVLSGIYNKLGKDIYDSVILTLCHWGHERADIIFRFLRTAFKEGRRVVNMLNIPEVMSFFETSRKTANESHLFLGFVRFDEVRGVLYSEIEPKCNVIPVIAEHFADRFPRENFIIFDIKRNYGVIHGRDNMIMTSGDVIRNFIKGSDLENSPAIHDDYGRLWKVFFDSIAIKERENPRCQRNLAPLWMRKHMNEFI